MLLVFNGVEELCLVSYLSVLWQCLIPRLDYLPYCHPIQVPKFPLTLFCFLLFLSELVIYLHLALSCYSTAIPVLPLSLETILAVMLAPSSHHQFVLFHTQLAQLEKSTEFCLIRGGGAPTSYPFMKHKLHKNHISLLGYRAADFQFVDHYSCWKKVAINSFPTLQGHFDLFFSHSKSPGHFL